MRRLITACSLAVFVLTLAACNTTEGAGEDMEDLGNEIEEAAE